MNHFDYFTEIEDEFVRRRGSHLLVSTLDWSLMETWRQRGIPLHIVLRAINQTFDHYDRHNRRGRKVNSLFFCRQVVEDNYFDYLESRIGGDPESHNVYGTDQPTPNFVSAVGSATTAETEENQPFSHRNIIVHLAEKSTALSTLAAHSSNLLLQTALNNAVSRLNALCQDIESATNFSAERLEQDLTLIEQSILKCLYELIPTEQLEVMKTAGRKLLRAYRETMPPDIYRQTLNNFIDRELRQLHQIPRLSLFYLQQ